MLRSLLVCITLVTMTTMAAVWSHRVSVCHRQLACTQATGKTTLLEEYMPGERLIAACVQTNDGNRGPSVMVWGAIHHGGGVSWSWWMEPWTGIGTSRSWGIKCCHGRRWCLDITLCISKTMPHPIQHVTRQPLWTNRMLRSWTGQIEIQTWTQLSMFGIKYQSGSETWMTPLPPNRRFEQNGRHIVLGRFWRFPLWFTHPPTLKS